MKKEENLDFDKVWLMFQETNLKFQETDKQLKKISLDIQEQGKQIGGLGNSFGRYTEGLLGPSIRKILETKFGAEYVTSNLKRKLNGEEFEIDYFGSCNGKVNKVFVVEVKTNLKDRHIEQLLKTVKMLPKIVPEQKGKKVYGIMAAVSYNDDQKQAILDNGFYFLNITNDLAHLDIPKNFKAKEY